MTDETPTPITDGEIAVLNAARAILTSHAKHATYPYPEKRDLIRSALAAEHAEHAIFEYLNVTNSYLFRGMTYAQLHNAPEQICVAEPEDVSA